MRGFNLFKTVSALKCEALHYLVQFVREIRILEFVSLHVESTKGLLLGLILVLKLKGILSSTVRLVWSKVLDKRRQLTRWTGWRSGLYSLLVESLNEMLWDHLIPHCRLTDAFCTDWSKLILVRRLLVHWLLIRAISLLSHMLLVEYRLESI